MDYGSIIAKAWDGVKKHRYLWWLGLLAAFTEGGSSFGLGSYSGGLPDFGDLEPSVSPSPTEVPSSLPAQGLPQGESAFREAVGQVLGTTTPDESFDAFMTSAGQWLMQNWQWLIVIALALFVLSLVVLYLSYDARAGLTVAADGMECHHSSSFAKAFAAGRPFAWRLFGLAIFINLMLLGVSAVIAFGGLLFFIGYMATESTAVLTLGIILGVIAVIGAIVLGVYLAIVHQLAQRGLVLNDQSILVAFEQARTLLHKQFTTVGLTWLISLGLVFAYTFVVGLLFLLVLLILAILGFALYTGSGLTAAIVYGAIMFIALTVAGWIVSGIFTAFINSYWVLAYRAIEYLKDKHHVKTT